MKSPFYALALGILAFGAVSCMSPTEKVYVASGYDEKDAYALGFRHGSNDRLAGKAHNPHINDFDDVPGAFRKDYTWGYIKGFENPYGGRRGSK